MANVPIYDQISNIIRRKILSGELMPGDRFKTVLELTREYDTTKATICKALDQLEREGLIARTRGRGTFVTEPKQVTVALVFDISIFSDSVSPYFAHIMREFCAESRKRNWAHKVYLNVDNDETAGEFLKDAEDGVFSHVVVGSRWVAENCAGSFARKNIVPVGLFDYPWLDSYVNFDAGMALDMAVLHLKKDGRRRIGMLKGVGERDYDKAFDIRKAFVDMLAKHGLIYDPSLYMECAYEVEDGCNTFMKMWQQKPDAVIFSDRILATGAMRAVYNLNINVPEQIHLVSQTLKGMDHGFPVPVSYYSDDVGMQLEEIFSIFDESMAGNGITQKTRSCPVKFEGICAAKAVVS